MTAAATAARDDRAFDHITAAARFSTGGWVVAAMCADLAVRESHIVRLVRAGRIVRRYADGAVRVVVASERAGMAS